MWHCGVVVITTAPQCRFKPCWQRVGDSQWWGSLTMVLAGNKAKHLLSVNHTTKSIHHHHHHHHHHHIFTKTFIEIHHLSQKIWIFTSLILTFSSIFLIFLPLLATENDTSIYNIISAFFDLELLDRLLKICIKLY